MFSFFLRYSVDIFQPPVSESSSGSDTSGSGSDTSGSSSPPHTAKVEDDPKLADAETIAKPPNPEDGEKDVDTQATQACDSPSTETGPSEEHTKASSMAGTSTEGSIKAPPTRYVMGRPQVPLQKEQVKPALASGNHWQHHWLLLGDLLHSYKATQTFSKMSLLNSCPTV